MQDTKTLEVGKIFQCRYRGNRIVKGIIESFTEETVYTRLTQEYVGKNATWGIGELKAVRLSVATKIHVTDK